MSARDRVRAPGVRGYGPALAAIHDQAFSGFARRSAPWLTDLLRRRVGEGGLVVELGCGSGVTAEALVAAGYEVLGVDLSEAMLRLARARVPRAEGARFVRASLHAFEPPACRAVLSVGECVNYCFDPAAGRASLGRLFRRAHAALEPGGLLVLDFAEPGRAQGGSQRRFEGEGWQMTVLVREDPRRRRLTRRIVTTLAGGRRRKRVEEVHELALFPATELAGELRALGFAVRVHRGWGELRFPPAYAGVVARKRGR